MPVIKDGGTTVFSADTTETKVKNYVNIKEQASRPYVPADGDMRLYARTDKKLYVKDDLANNFDLKASPSACKAKRSSTQSISDATITSLLWNAEDFDTDTYHDTSTNTDRIIAPYASFYKVKGALHFDSWSTGASPLKVELWKNGAAFKTLINRNYALATGVLVVPFDYQVFLLPTEYISIRVTQTTGSARNVDTNSYLTISQVTPYNRIEVRQEPKGHDVSLLTDVIAHFPMRSSILGGTSVPDVVGTFSATASATLVACGRPWKNSEGQVWVNQKCTLADVATLVPLLRDNSCAVMFWAQISRADTTSTSIAVEFFGVVGPDDTAAKNTIFEVRLEDNFSLRTFWEFGNGTNVFPLLTRIAPGRRHICVAREHNTGAGTSTVHCWVDGVLVSSQSGQTNPSGGTTVTTGFIMVDSNGSGLDAEFGASVTDLVVIAGSIPTTNDVLTQYKRGLGIY